MLKNYSWVNLGQFSNISKLGVKKVARTDGVTVKAAISSPLSPGNSGAGSRWAIVKSLGHLSDTAIMPI